MDASRPDTLELARTLASGAASVAIGASADYATITTNNNTFTIDAGDLDALRDAMARVLPQPRRNLPEADPAFRGRAGDEAALRAALEAGGGSQAVTALKGLGGIGKTELAIRVAHAVAPLYPAAQILVDLQGTAPTPVVPQAAMEDVIHRFEPGAKLPDDPDDVGEIYRDLLRRQRSLLILDNARDTAQALPLLPPPPSAAIVTSRATLDLPGVPTRRLDCLERPESIAVLAAHLAAHDPPAVGLDTLAAACVDHPLSLRVAGLYLANRWDFLAIEAYAARIVANRATLVIAGEKGKIDVMAALDLSLQLLAAHDPDLAERWRDLAVFPSDFDAAAAAAVWPGDAADPAAAFDQLLALADLGMLEPGTARGRFRLHDLIHELARLNQPDARFGDAALRHAAHFCEVLAAADDIYLQGGTANTAAALKRFDQERPNIEAGQAWSAANLADSPAAAGLASDFPDAGVYVLDLRQHRRTRISWLESGLAAARIAKRRQAEGNHLGNLGLALAALGEARAAIGLHEQALAILREIGNQRGEGSCLGNLGNAHADLGEARAAIEYYEQALGIAQETGDRRVEGNQLGNLGVAHAELGDTRAAIDYYEQALAIVREIGDRRGEGSHLNNLGNAHVDLGGARLAIDYFEQALAIAREIGDRRGEGSRLANLGNAHAKLGETGLAIDYFEQALVIAREIGDRRGEGSRLRNLGLAHADLGDTGSAVEYSKQALEIFAAIGDPRAELVQDWLRRAGT